MNARGGSPFEVEPPSEAWAAALAGFGWLRHLRAADTALARVNARALVGDWIAGRGRGGAGAGPGWRPEVAARRVLSWLSQSPLILDGADGVFYRRFTRSLARHADALLAALDRGLAGVPRLTAIVALCELSLCAEGLGRLQRRASRLLAEELGRQILSDGGHVSRDPQALLDLLLDLLPLRQAYAARGVPPPAALLGAIDRMIADACAACATATARWPCSTAWARRAPTWSPPCWPTTTPAPRRRSPPAPPAICGSTPATPP